MKRLFKKIDFPKAPGGDRYEWKGAETVFKLPKKGRYLIAITSSCKNGQQNNTGDDDDLRISINGYEFGKNEAHAEQISYQGFGTSAAWDGASLKGGNKTIYFLMDLDAKNKNLFWPNSRREQVIKFYADGKPVIKQLEVFQLKPNHPFTLKNLRPQDRIATKVKGVPWVSFVFLGSRPRNLQIATKCQSGKQKEGKDGDNVKVVLNGQIIKNPVIPTPPKYKNFYFSGDQMQGKSQRLSLKPSAFSHLENALELWYDEAPLLEKIEIHFFNEDDLGKYIIYPFPFSLLPFPKPSREHYELIQEFLISNNLKQKSNSEMIDSLWFKTIEITNNNFKEATNLLVYLCYVGAAIIDYETDSERKERIEALPNSIFDNDQKDNRDKLQHFFGSANLTFRFGKNLTKFLSGTKEQIDKYFSDNGFDAEDIEANKRGILFGLSLKREKYSKPSDFLKK